MNASETELNSMPKSATSAENSPNNGDASTPSQPSLEGKSMSVESLTDWINLGPHKLLEEAPLAVLVVSGDGKIMFANRMSVTLFGYARAELVGKEIHFLVPDDRRPKHANFVGGWFMHPKARPMGADLGIEGRNKNGDLIKLDIQLSPVETDTGVLAVAWIGERK